jgi:lipopolysaccharide heptosyltransferase II
VERFVVVAPNWLGDAVMSLPALADLRRARPDATIAIAVRPSIAPLFSLTRGLDEVVVLPRGGPVSLERFETAILFPNSFHSALLAARAGVRERWGYRTDWRGLLLTRGIDRPTPMHQIDYYQRLTTALGFPAGPSTPRIDIPDDVRASGRSALMAAGWDGRSALAAVAPGAAYGSAKRWPATAFADLIAGLAEDGVTTVMTGAAADQPVAREVVRSLGARAHVLDLVDRTDIPGLAGVLARCRTLIANDSGALHLAAALGVKVAAVFGPTDDRLTAPRPANPDQKTAVVTNETWCRPCGLRECPLDHACMRGVTPADVLAAARPIL